MIHITETKKEKKEIINQLMKDIDHDFQTFESQVHVVTHNRTP